MNRLLRKGLGSDSHLYTQIEPTDEEFQQNLLQEISNLRCKLDTKSKSLKILSQDLMQMKHERDEYKLMAEQLSDRFSTLKRRVESMGPGLSGVYQSPTLTNSALNQVLIDLTDQNKQLLHEIDELKTQLLDAEGDLKVLREQVHSLKIRSYENDLDFPALRSPMEPMSQRSMEDVVTQLETFRSRIQLMERDLQCVLDEKEELILSRDEYKAKVDRLNKRLSDTLRSGANGWRGKKGGHDGRLPSSLTNQDGAAAPLPKVLDIDSIVTENSYLKERVSALQDEKKLTENSLHKYKSIFEKANAKKNILNSIGFRKDVRDTPSNDPPSPAIDFDLNSVSGNVISSKQVQQFISSNNLNSLEVTQNSVTHLRSLVIALFEGFSDKTSALTIQKKNNKLLGKRISELEDKIKELQAKEKVFLLMKNDESDLHLDMAMALPEDSDGTIDTVSLDHNLNDNDEESNTSSVSSIVARYRSSNNAQN
ncbi:Coiled-coil domain-containing protein [Halotydeus destructor]|nr:Coiled-coil domain-containing protein [Halotydeus destructor]